MKILMAIILSIVAVFCVFTGCSGDPVDIYGNNGAQEIEFTDNAKDGENQGGGNEEKPDNNDDGQGETDSEGQDENDSDGNERDHEDEKEEKPKYVPVDPISDGGDFAGGNYN